MGRVYIPTDETFPRAADVVVVGGGIVGVATAFWLSRAGLDTVLVEMRDGLSTLTTAASAECFRAQFAEPAMMALAKPSIEIFENFAEVVGLPDYDISLRQEGYLFMTDDPQMIDQLKAAVEKHRSLGVTDSEFLTGDEVRDRFPYVSPDVVAATFRQRDGWLACHEMTYGFAKGSDANFLIRTKVTDVLLDGQGVCGVETSRGAISTRVAVNTAGPFAAVIGKMAGLEIPIETVRRQKVIIGPLDCVPPDACMTIDLVNDAYWRPEVQGGLLGWVDPAELGSDPMENVPTDYFFPAIVLEKVARLTPFWEEVGEGLKDSDVHISAGQYCYTPDDQPLIGPVPDVPGFYLNCGYWAGVMLSPAGGKRLADLVAGAMDPQDNPLRPTRFEEGIVVESDSFLRGRH
ncbi:MAG: FAD-binding oxidoreductase [Chloroflexi bacterium]|nr:FAD-binding oxidoreductase [Chloroflexota bacterium]